MSKTKNKRIRVVDLFSGVGGLTFGFTHRIENNKFTPDESFEIIFANDFSKAASTAFALNYPQIKIINDSIENIDLDYLKNRLIDCSNIDVVIGGPPCQSYSTIGKRKDDTRAKMYKEYFRLIQIINPKMFVFENVVGILSFKDDSGNKVIDKIKTNFKNIGYDVELKVLNAKEFGVPQNRMRVFVVGIKTGLGLMWSFPNTDAANIVTVNDAIGDLPPVNCGESAASYIIEPFNNYQKLMRNDNHILNEHFARKHGDRINRIIRFLGPGEKHDDINRKVREGLIPEDLYLTSGYNNSYARLWLDKPSATITNNFGTPSANRCIHPTQNRALTVREAARLQSFPDNFVFYGTTTQKASQVGNAVPPLLAIKIAEMVKATINGENV